MLNERKGRVIMRNMKKLVWGILLALAGIAVVLFAIFPEYGPVGVPAWKWLIGAMLLWWLIDHLLFGHGLRERLDIFLQLGFLFMVFESNIAGLIGREDDFVNNWLILGAAILLTIAVKLIFSGKKHHRDEQNAMSSSVIYLDASDGKERTISNKMGDMSVFYQNTDLGDTTKPVRLYVTNKMSNLTIHVPADWTVNVKASNVMGDISVRDSSISGGRLFIVEGSNVMGELAIVSP